MTCRKACLLLAPALLVLAVSSPAGAQVSPPPNRDQGWGTATTVTMATAGALELLMPRIFYSDPEVTVGFKARWHVSQLAPVMTLTVLTLTNELLLKGAIKDPRPGCDDTNAGGPHCDTYGSPSTHAFGSFAALGNGAAIWLFDMTKWSDGRFNAGSFVGNLVMPLVLGVVTDVGRGVGNWEGGGQILAGSLAGVGLGFLTGMTYSLMSRPECGYTGSLICW
ncbi:MAG TPA: hypothetical protein VIF15_00335 [Polyangiaceae bacterium]|jgi:hypothetical protein